MGFWAVARRLATVAGSTNMRSRKTCSRLTACGYSEADDADVEALSVQRGHRTLAIVRLR